MHPEDFLRLLYNSRQIIGNSSVAIRECVFLGVPAVNIGSRQSGRDRGLNVIDVDYDREQIASAIQRHLHDPRPGSDPLYGDGRAGDQIAELLATLPLKYQKRLNRSMAPNILGLIPARGGSKGVLRKNIRIVAGEPLISYSIQAALKSGLLNPVIVSTDDREIADFLPRLVLRF